MTLPVLASNVYVTDGGSAYHEDPRCRSLVRGTYNLGSPIDRDAVVSWMKPCKRCVPDQGAGS
jgi:hypothetical protein